MHPRDSGSAGMPISLAMRMRIWFAVALVVLFCGFYVPILRDASIDQNLDFLYQPPVIEAENAYQAPGACGNYSGILQYSRRGSVCGNWNSVLCLYNQSNPIFKIA
jgi:hypothetical protein